MTDLTDSHGRTVSVTGDGPFTLTVQGMTVTANTVENGLTTLTGMAPWVDPATLPPPPTPTVADTATFVARFTAAEQTAIASNPATLTFWLLMLGQPKVDTLSASLIAGLNTATSLGALAPGREQEILNLGVTSP